MNLISQLKENISKIFPKSYLYVGVEKGLGDPHILIRFTLADKGEYENGIAQNDKAGQIIFIYGVDAEGNPRGNKLATEIVQGQSITVLPTEKFLAFGRIKTGWRNFSGDEKTTIKRITKYFENLMILLIDAYDSAKLTDDAKKLMVEKGYIEIASGGRKLSKGGKLVGASHDDGGIDIIVPNGKIEAEGGEIIINKKSSDKYCSVLSKINEAEGGNKIPCSNTKAKNGMKTEEENKKYKVVKIFRKSGRRETLEKNLSREEAMRVVNSYPNSNTSMVVFYEMAQRGTKIENQYKGRIAKDIWESWSIDQRRNFISDHVYKITELAKVLKEKLNKDLFFYTNTGFFENLPKSIQREISYHVHEGEYKSGGKTPSNKTRYKSVDTRNLKGLKEAERLQRSGWKITGNGLYTIQFRSPDSETIEKAEKGKKIYTDNFIYKKGNKIDEFLNKKHDVKGLFKKGFSKTKEASKNAYNKGKEAYKKSVKDSEKRTTMKVLENVKGQVKLKQYKDSIDESENLVKDLYKNGNRVKNKNWIGEATRKNKGSLRKTAKREGLIHGKEKLSLKDIKTLEHSKNKTTRKRAHLAETLSKINKNKK